MFSMTSYLAIGIVSLEHTSLSSTYNIMPPKRSASKEAKGRIIEEFVENPSTSVPILFDRMFYIARL